MTKNWTLEIGWFVFFRCFEFLCCSERERVCDIYASRLFLFVLLPIRFLIFFFLNRVVWIFSLDHLFTLFSQITSTANNLRLLIDNRYLNLQGRKKPKSSKKCTYNFINVWTKKKTILKALKRKIVNETTAHSNNKYSFFCDRKENCWKKSKQMSVLWAKEKRARNENGTEWKWAQIKSMLRY